MTTNQMAEIDSVSTSVLTEMELPSLIFAIPFPKAAPAYQTTKDTPPFLLYTFPRSTYEKPPKNPITGKRKQKLGKMVQRKWQEEIKQGEDLKRGEIKDAHIWSRFKGAIVRDAATVIKSLPDNAIEVLGRLPPKTKFGKLTIIYADSQSSSVGLDVNYRMENEIEKDFLDLLSKARNKARARTVIAGCLLPVTLAMEAFIVVPTFVFEINLAYFSVQVAGLQKAKVLGEIEKKKSSQASKGKSEERKTLEPKIGEVEDEQSLEESIQSEETGLGYTFQVARPGSFDRTIEHLYNICSSLDPLKFPLIESFPIQTYLPKKEIVTALIEIFQEHLPSEVINRHVLDAQRLAEDLDFALKKAAREYVKTLSKPSESNQLCALDYFSQKMNNFGKNRTEV